MKKIHRSSKTGKIVTEKFADAHPATTQEETSCPSCRHAISEVTESFGNGEVNILRDKINEIIRAING